MQATHNPSTIAFPWGPTETLALDLPPLWTSETLWPDLSNPIADYREALRHALDHPEGGKGIETLARPGQKVAIVVDDPSRWTPVSDVLPHVLMRLRISGITTDDVSISAGVGRHHAVDDAAMRRRVGDEVASEYRCYSPPVDDVTQYVDLGTTPEGVPVRVFRPVAEADLRILIGSVLPHLQAGFGGGYKLIFPGCSHRSTLAALHRQGLGGDAGKLLGGDLDANPMRNAIRSAARLLPGSCLSISHLLGDSDQVFRVHCGEVDTVQRMLSNEAERRFRAPPGAPVDVVIAGNNPWPGDPMMSFKVLINHRAAAKPGGLLIGVFWTDPEAIGSSFPIGALRAIAATGAAGGWVARRGLSAAERVAETLGSASHFMIRWARELVVDRTVMVYAPLLAAKLGPRLGPIRLFDDQQDMWDATHRWLRRIENPTARIFPRGGLTYFAP